MSESDSRKSLGSKLAQVDAHVVTAKEYDELPELDKDMLDRAVVKKAGRPRATHPKEMISLRLPSELVDKWRATGPGWQTRMAERLARAPLPRAKSGA